MADAVIAFVAGQTLRFRYLNHRGITGMREVRPVLIRWGISDYYLEPQWLMRALDLDKGEWREFAVARMDMNAAQTGLPLLRGAKGDGGREEG